MPNGCLRRCTVFVRKPFVEKYYQQEKHSYKIVQADDPGFPDGHQDRKKSSKDKKRQKSKFCHLLWRVSTRC
jgi:hypothetical protein